MQGEWMAALEATGLAVALRNSVWTYPLVNAGHILGVALLVGGIVPLDLRLMNIWRPAPLGVMWRIGTRTAGAGLALTVACGLLLFIARAGAYAGSSIFLAKMAVVAVGMVNIIALHWIAPAHRWQHDDGPPHLGLGVRVAAGLSMSAWLAALVLGRLVGYF
jgi:hypothetical protein